MSGPEKLPEGQCVCGRDLPDEPLSDWACSEPCQSAWMHWHANPDVYPHPREIRAAAEARGPRPAPVRVRPPFPGRADVPLTQVPDGTAIDVDGERYVRVGAHWEPAGTWAPLRSDLAAVVEYRRWCPRCRERRSMVQTETTQACATCDHRWRGRPLVGVVESRGEPWPGLRLRLTDGHRSTTFAFTEQEILAAGVDMAARIDACWRRMERQLCGGVADVDDPDDRTRSRAERRLERSWHWNPGRAVDITPNLSRWLP